MSHVGETVIEELDDKPQRLRVVDALGLDRLGLSLFWRTFCLLSLLLFGCILAWQQTLKALEFEPRVLQTAQQLASQVNLSRAALMHTDAIARVSLLKTMGDEEGLQISLREPSDQFVVLEDNALNREVAREVIKRLGPGTVVASVVNRQPGLWIGFEMSGDRYWLHSDPTRLIPAGGKTWTVWLVIAAALSLAGAAIIARLINRPLKELSFAASRVREGNFAASHLDESVHTSEIREVNIGFNRMAQKLEKIEQDRAVMLAGISHDLRTPLARLRLETELSVSDLDAREHMAADIAQLDAIIDKFLDYARPDKVKLLPVLLADVVEACTYAYMQRDDVQIQVLLDKDLRVLADDVELGRVISNLLENACRYGKTPQTGIARIDIVAIAKEKRILLKIRDFGLGVAAEQLGNITKPFFRGEAARTAANGAGLGLAIVEKTVQRMGGEFALVNAQPSGLAAHIQLQRTTKA